MTPAVRVRGYRAGDAPAISDLFRVVYGDHYVHPEVYLPSQIEARHRERRWQSVVAESAGRLVGPATLWRDPRQPHEAELALFVVHPQARGQGLSARLARPLRACAQAQGCGLVCMHQVCSHPRSQGLARALGFVTCALLLDHVPSPFGRPEPESLVLGCLPLRPRRLPRLGWPPDWHDWLAPLRARFGEVPVRPGAPAHRPLALARHGHRIDVAMAAPSARGLAEVAALPLAQLIHLRLPASQAALALRPALRAGGFRFGGLVPGPRAGWQLLYLRGHRPPPAVLLDPRAAALQGLDEAPIGEIRHCRRGPDPRSPGPGGSSLPTPGR